jgi:hypothetical protein
MGKLYHSLSNVAGVIQAAIAVSSSLDARRRPKDADLRRVGIDPASFTVRL